MAAVAQDSSDNPNYGGPERCHQMTPLQRLTGQSVTLLARFFSGFTCVGSIANPIHASEFTLPITRATWMLLCCGLLCRESCAK